MAFSMAQGRLGGGGGENGPRPRYGGWRAGECGEPGDGVEAESGGAGVTGWSLRQGVSGDRKGTGRGLSEGGSVWGGTWVRLGWAMDSSRRAWSGGASSAESRQCRAVQECSRTALYSCTAACLPAFLPSCPPAFLPSCLPAFLPSCLPDFLRPPTKPAHGSAQATSRQRSGGRQP
jgi:hypothetical protein